MLNVGDLSRSIRSGEYDGSSKQGRTGDASLGGAGESVGEKVNVGDSKTSAGTEKNSVSVLRWYGSAVLSTPRVTQCLMNHCGFVRASLRSLRFLLITCVRLLNASFVDDCLWSPKNWGSLFKNLLKDLLRLSGSRSLSNNCRSSSGSLGSGPVLA